MNRKVTDIKEETVTKYMKAINEVCSQRIVEMKSHDFRIGGTGTIVEIDEVHLAERSI